ncbi:hypothetical protein GpartN1_g3683.t1 [Galdieria partita]|uniref:Uncharacterized protein n=1 Tax=Galdieria partita TaxID=83374 RepID=A0A9C7PYL1_9RHOD|nr:hypothetical protein GpartN1_g3683.t1 [Galdieria partita]
MFDLGVTTETKVSRSKLLVEKYLTEQQGDFGGNLITSPLSSTSAGSNLSHHCPVFTQLPGSSENYESFFQEERAKVLMDGHSEKRKKTSKGRKPGRPPSLFVNVSDSELTEEERKLKAKILKRRQRQNRSYQRKKLERSMLRKDSPVSKVIEATSNEQVTKKVPSLFGSSSSSVSVECGNPLYNTGNKCSSSYLDDLEGYPSNSFSCSSSLEESSFDDPLHQLLRQDVDSGSETYGTRRDIAQSMWSPSELCIDHSANDMFDNVLPARSAVTASTWNRLENVFNGLTVSAQEAWKAFSIFADTFDCAAAFHVLGWSESERSVLLNMIDSLEQSNVLKVDPSESRLQLYPVAKCFIIERILKMSGYHRQKFEIFKYRYLGYYSQLIQQHVNDTMFLQLGSCKQQALRIYHLEKANIEQAFQVAKELGWRTYRWFVVATGCLLRYVWDLSTRKEQYCSLLQGKDIENQVKLLSDSPVGVEQLYLEEEKLDSFLNDNSLSMTLDRPPYMEESVILRMIGEAYFEDKDLKNAHAYLSRCLQHTSQQISCSLQQCTNNEVFCFYLLACIEKENGQWDTALSFAERAKNGCIYMKMELTVVWIQIHLLMTSIYIKLSRLEEAYSTMVNVCEWVQSAGISYDVSLFLELDALLGTVLQLKGDGTCARHCFESIRKHPNVFYDWDMKNICCCDYLLDCRVWSCLESLSLNSDCVYHSLMSKQEVVDTCSYLFDQEASLSAIQEEYEWDKTFKFSG